MSNDRAAQVPICVAILTVSDSAAQGRAEGLTEGEHTPVILWR